MEAVPAKRSTLQAGTTLGGTYTIGRTIGAGGMGEVYEARHARLAGRYAVKVIRADLVALDPITVQRFQREAEVMSSLRHPNIVQIIDFDVASDGSPFIVMEYLEGSDLQARIAQRGPMPVSEVLVIAEQVASALAAAHERGVVHRDLKPANIFMVPLPVAVQGQPSEFIKVLDFGISKVKSAGTLTGEPRILGTPHYMAPEQARAKSDDIDGRADQFALASIAYELLSGRKAFPGDTIEGVLYSVIYEQPVSIVPVVGELIDAVLRTALSKERSGRYPSVSAFVGALRAAAARTGNLPAAAGPRHPAGITFETDSAIKPVAAEVPPAPAAAATPATVKPGGILRRNDRMLIVMAATAAVIAAVGIALMNRHSRPEVPVVSASQVALLVPSVRARIEEILATKRKGLESRVSAAVRIPELRNAAATRIDAFTFNDLFATEDWWQPYLDLGAIVFDGDRPLVTRGAPDVADAAMWRFWTHGQGKVASAIVPGERVAYLASGLNLDARGAFGLVLAEALSPEVLSGMAKTANLHRLLISDGKRLYGLAASAPSAAGGPVTVAALPGREGEGAVTLSTGEVAVALAAPSGVWVWAVVDGHTTAAP
ncbi:MAG TPA: serine/threonine-protein kinase [Polyangia bacterium]|nr:serine/threonine-protein kinase [Polyangia bacterium]